MIRLLHIAFISILFVLSANGLIYADRDCTRTVVCSDGTELITTRCSSSYQIIDGHIVGDGDDDHHGDHHHGGDYYDPCTAGHGHSVDKNTGSDDPYNLKHGQHHGYDPDDPYNLRHGHHRDYDPDDPYGLKQSHHQTNNEVLTNQSQ